MIAPSIWLDVRWDTLEFLAPHIRQFANEHPEGVVQHELDNLAISIEAQLQKRPLEVTAIVDLL